MRRSPLPYFIAILVICAFALVVKAENRHQPSRRGSTHVQRTYGRIAHRPIVHFRHYRSPRVYRFGYQIGHSIRQQIGRHSGYHHCQPRHCIHNQPRRGVHFGFSFSR